MKIIILGGGAAGFFAALACKQINPQSQVIILEKTAQLLAKVKISGGGRCNVTQGCFNLRELAQGYPRGEKELLGALHHFGPKQTIDWFAQRGVELKIEDDRRVFPKSDSSQTIIDCFLNEAKKLDIKIFNNVLVQSVSCENDQFILKCDGAQTQSADRIIFASGSSQGAWTLLKSLGHRIVDPVPSLFTFTVQDDMLNALSGLSVQDAFLRIKQDRKLSSRGAVLLTHWGLSGPASIRLSAFAARFLAQANYRCSLQINWLPKLSQLQLQESFVKFRQHFPRKTLATSKPFDSIPLRLWNLFVQKAGLLPEKLWGELSQKNVAWLIEKISNDNIEISGRGIFKEEFVTAGGVDLKQIDFKTMQSRLVSGLYFAGEVIDVDGITGGYNFQNAWTSGYIAGSSAGKK